MWPTRDLVRRVEVSCERNKSCFRTRNACFFNVHAIDVGEKITGGVLTARCRPFEKEQSGRVGTRTEVPVKGWPLRAMEGFQGNPADD